MKTESAARRLLMVGYSGQDLVAHIIDACRCTDREARNAAQRVMYQIELAKVGWRAAA
jgi:hypothetical protein